MLNVHLDEWEVTKTKHPNKGHTPNKGQRPMYQSVRYSESPLYTTYSALVVLFTLHYNVVNHSSIQRGFPLATHNSIVLFSYINIIIIDSPVKYFGS